MPPPRMPAPQMPPEPPQPPQPPAPRLTEELATVFAHEPGKLITLGELAARLHGRELGVLLLVVGLPFLVPMPSPGLSTPFGLAVALLGLRYAWREEFRLPSRLARHAISPRMLALFRRVALSLSRRIEWLVHPRLPSLLTGRGRLIVAGAIISAALALAVPGPASNVVPALSLIALALGLLGRDGIFLLVGTVLSAASWLYVVLIGYIAIQAVAWLRVTFAI